MFQSGFLRRRLSAVAAGKSSSAFSLHSRALAFIHHFAVTQDAGYEAVASRESPRNLLGRTHNDIHRKGSRHTLPNRGRLPHVAMPARQRHYDEHINIGVVRGIAMRV